jgi:RNA polymerase sigma factor (TIGR02999 family)
MKQRQFGAMILPKRGNHVSLSPGERVGVRASYLHAYFPPGVQVVSSPDTNFGLRFTEKLPMAIQCALLGRLSEFTHILQAVQQGDPKAAEELLPLIYAELRKLAAVKMANEAAGHTLQPTALVHEAWLRLVGTDQPKFENRSHFFAVAAEAMRRILIDRARRKLAQRRGGGQVPVDLDEVEIAAPAAEDQLLAVNEALDKLAVENKLQAELVKLRYFVGLTNEESAKLLGISARSAKYCWTHARAWLFQEISASQNRPEP